MNKKEENIRAIVDSIINQASDEGRLIDSGWKALKLLAVPGNATENQVNDMRMCYFAGAQHLFASIINILDPGSEPTEKDMQCIGLIHEELLEFYNEMKMKAEGKKGKDGSV